MAFSHDPFEDLIPQRQQAQPAEEQMSPIMAGITGFNTGVERFTHGILQPVFEKMGNNWKRGSQQVAAQREGDYQKAYQAHPGITSGASIAGGVGATLPLAAIPGMGQTALARAATSGAIQGGLTGAGQYVNEGESRLNNALLGGLTGSAAGAALQGLGTLGAKTYNAIRGNYSDPAEEAVVALGKQYNVPVFASDASKSSLMKGTGQALEAVPYIGINRERQVQMHAAKEAAEGIVDKFKNAMDETAYGGRTGLRSIGRAADESSIRAASAKDVLKQVTDAGDDWNRIMQTSGNVQLMRAKLLADAKYNKVSQLADGLGAVPTTHTAHTVENALKEISSGNLVPNKPLINTLNTIKENINQPFNYSQLRRARGQVGSLIDDYFSGTNAAVGKDGVGYLQSIKNALGQDLDAFANNHGSQLKTVWKNADNFYGNYVAPAKSKALAQALKTEKPDEIYNQFIKIGGREGGKGSGSAKVFYDALDNKGRAAVRYGMVSDAFERAYKPDLDQFSPAQFAGQLERYAAAKGVFFNGTEKAEINGFKNLMRHVERSAQAINKPDTGVKTIPWLAVGGAGAYATNVPTVLGITGMTYGIKKLFTSDAGKRFLLAASTLKPGSSGMQGAMETLRRILQQGLVTSNMERKTPDESSPVNALPMDSNDPFADLIPAR